MKTYNILLYGCGQIGFRHLQGILKCKEKINIYVYDINQKQIELVKKKIVIQNNNLKKKYLNFSNVLFKNLIFDIVIMANTSTNRLLNIKHILKTNSTKNIIVEKVPFQSIEEFIKAKNFLNNRLVKTWINCPNRAYKSYSNLKKIFYGNNPLEICVKGGNWGLASNLIHYLDLFSFFLLDKKEIRLKKVSLSKFYRSKRKGYKEVSGFLKFETKNNDILRISETKNISIPLTIEIFKGNNRVIIFEEQNKIIYLCKNNYNNLEFNSFKIEYQSSLTTKLIERILKNKKPGLPELDLSLNLHKTFMNKLLTEFNKNSYVNKKNLPIT